MLTIIQPSPASQQRSCSALRNRSLSAPSFTSTKTWSPSDPGRACRYRRAIIRRWSSAAHEGGVASRPAAPSAAPPRSRRPLKLGRNSGRHALAVVVQQRERRAVIDDIGVGAGDDVRPRHAIDQLCLVVTSTLSGRSARRVPSASACDGVRPSISAPSAATPATLTRSAVPCDITQAEPSFTSVPSGAREIRLVSGPPSLVSLVSSISSGGGGRALFSAGGSPAGVEVSAVLPWPVPKAAARARAQVRARVPILVRARGFGLGLGWLGLGFGLEFGLRLGLRLGLRRGGRNSGEFFPRMFGIPQLRPNFRSTRIGTSSRKASQPSRATSSPCSRVATEHSSASCICRSGTIPSRQQARIHSLVWRAADPWMSAFIAVWGLARRIQRRCQGWLGSRTRRSASSREHGPMPSVQAMGASPASRDAGSTRSWTRGHGAVLARRGGAPRSRPQPSLVPPLDPTRRDPQSDERADPGLGGAPHQAVDAGLLARRDRPAAADARRAGLLGGDARAGRAGRAAGLRGRARSKCRCGST